MVQREELTVSFDIAISALIVMATYSGFAVRQLDKITNIAERQALERQYLSAPTIVFVLLTILIAISVLVRVKGWKRVGGRG